MRVTLDQHQKALEISNGHRYRANRRGQIQVNDASDLRTIKDAIGLPHVGFSEATTGEKRCERCHFTAWPWSSPCPRCGNEFPEYRHD